MELDLWIAEGMHVCGVDIRPCLTHKGNSKVKWLFLLAVKSIHLGCEAGWRGSDSLMVSLMGREPKVPGSVPSSGKFFFSNSFKSQF